MLLKIKCTHGALFGRRRLTTVKRVWNDTVFVLLILFGFVIALRNSLPLGPIQR